MHDGRIQVVMPSVFGRLDATSGEPNYVRVSTSVRGVPDPAIGGVDDRVIISTGDLDAGETITVHIQDVDIPDAFVNTTQFVVSTKTRGAAAELLRRVLSYKLIAPANITGGAIRTIKGSGMMAVTPANVEQGTRNVDFTARLLRQRQISRNLA